ncbi:hypothetical protein BKA93DRAFT_824116 [Sparassis latifolia]
MMMNHLKYCAEVNAQLSREVIIANLVLPAAVLKMNMQDYHNGTTLPPVLRKVEELIQKDQQRCLYFPAFLPEHNHWIAFEINFMQYEISYADSIGYHISKPKLLLDKLEQWLSARFKSHFSECGNRLTHGIQQDDFSCGVCTVNAITHAVFGDPLWTVQHKGLERVQWFHIFCDSHEDHSAAAIMPTEQGQETHVMDEIRHNEGRPRNCANECHSSPHVSDTTPICHPKMAIPHLLNPVDTSEYVLEFADSREAEDSGINEHVSHTSALYSSHETQVDLVALCHTSDAAENPDLSSSNCRAEAYKPDDVISNLHLQVMHASYEDRAVTDDVAESTIPSTRDTVTGVSVDQVTELSFNATHGVPGP